MLDTALMAVRDDNDIARSIQDTQDLMSDLGFTSTPVLSKNQVFSGILGATELDRIFDGENKKLKQLVMTPKKGFEIKEWSNKMTVSFLASQWLRKSKTLAGASFDTMEEIGTLSRQTKYLALGLELTKRYEMISILTRGFAVTSTYGPGSPSPIDGLALFSASHTYNNGGGTFSNTTSASLTDSNLQIALTALKTGVRMQNGKFVV